MELVQEKQKNAFATLKGDFGYTNVMQAPKLQKVVISVGTGSVKDKEKVKVIIDRLARITGQKASSRTAKKAIASFKSRQGQVIGFQVTLRGERMHDFLNKLIHIALPRTRDFRGLPTSAIDEMGNYTLGIKENSIFPETSDEDLKDIFGLAITIVTSAKTKKEAEGFLRHIGLPLQK